MVCSPWQSRFFNVTSSEWLKVEDSTEEVVVATEYHLSELLTTGRERESCRKVDIHIVRSPEPAVPTRPDLQRTRRKREEKGSRAVSFGRKSRPADATS
ncbi:hypothetical protein AVEN_61242-1 [Araneus ventricosus]|uniref:Uncharacterized protein n=1 Tax=Araneus ventricosus TaxID=182803 RepID=A0A4Y2AVR4_ARAVE|nr:hypothetical protein AVEN_61242-1 [Araneus ventricosus]